MKMMSTILSSDSIRSSGRKDGDHAVSVTVHIRCEKLRKKKLLHGEQRIGCGRHSPRQSVRPSSGCHGSSGVIETIEVIREDPSIVDVDTPEAIEPTEDGAVAPRNLLATVADIYWSGLGKSRWD